MNADTTRADILTRWEPVIGLEVHVQLNTKTKLFCSCPNQSGGEPNRYTCPVCLGLPGALPVVNRQAIESAIKLGLAINGKIRMYNRFARKNYFYPDMPKGYQISQYDEPIIDGGSVPIWWKGELISVALTRVHMEGDAGKSIHDDEGNTLVDYNRSDVPLLEIVSEPVLHDPDQTHLFLERLRQIVRYLDISDANMELGQLRCDANISLRPRGHSGLGTKTEMKNMNSFRSVKRALQFEIERQAGILDKGGAIEQCTLLWNEEKNRAEIMRSKEDAPDYRYFPDPDLVPMDLSKVDIAGVRASLPELPHVKEQRWMDVHGLRLEDAQILAGDSDTADYYEACVREGIDGKTAAKWILGEVLRLINKLGVNIGEFRVSPQRLAELIHTIGKGTINLNTGKRILAKLVTEDRSIDEIIRSEGLGQISTEGELLSVVEDVIARFGKEADRYRRGEKKLIGFFMGQVMRATRGQSDPGKVKKMLEQKLRDQD
ncbi:MAG: Asp-tRNA(Asn)/Glu-tRNA(Gln) amidotransferase subunit GatB [FCB group bacterium]|nr:Asp-tRNA(Asn)/Glu-tRNA(Gln) amidotransferase subunit GatB [FCB group bacterium]